MSATKKVVLIVSAILLVCLIGAAVIVSISFANGNPPDFLGFVKGESRQIDESAELDLAGIENVKVTCVSGDVVIAPGEPRAELTGSIVTSTPKDSYLSVSSAGDTLTVKYDAQTTFPVTLTSHITLKVYLPEDALVQLAVSGASNDTSISGLKLANMTVESASGSASISDCDGDTLSVHMTSGQIEVRNVEFETIDAGCTSGDTTIENTTASVKVGSTSGTIRIADVQGSVQANNTSGGVYITQTHSDIDPISVQITSGPIELKLNKDAAFNLSTHSTSGGVKSDFDIMVSGTDGSISRKDLSGKVNGGGPSVDLDTTSGSIRVLKITE